MAMWKTLHLQQNPDPGVFESGAHSPNLKSAAISAMLMEPKHCRCHPVEHLIFPYKIWEKVKQQFYLDLKCLKA